MRAKMIVVGDGSDFVNGVQLVVKEPGNTSFCLFFVFSIEELLKTFKGFRSNVHCVCVCHAKDTGNVTFFSTKCIEQFYWLSCLSVVVVNWNEKEDYFFDAIIMRNFSLCC